jgi:alpha-beta hydrolase superfamily lysophospholipase
MDLRGHGRSGEQRGYTKSYSELRSDLKTFIEIVQKKEAGLDASAISREPAVVEAYRSDPLVHSKGTPRLGAEEQAAIVWTNTHLAELKLPLLTIQGEADRLVPLDATRILYEQAGSTDK